MSVTIDHAKATAGLIKGLRAGKEPEPFTDRDPLDEFVYSFLLWEAPRAKAEPAIKRLLANVADHNELRVTRDEEIAEILGKTYPRGLERATRLTTALNEIYLREYAVTLEPCLAMSKRDGRKYLETLEGIPPFASARVALRCLDAHAIPVDERLMVKLIEEGVIEDHADIATTTGILERHLKAGEGGEAHLRLQAWADGDIRPKSASRGRSTAKKTSKKSARKPAASRTSRRR